MGSLYLFKMQIKVSISNIIENDFFEFPKLEWQQLTGEVGRFISFRCHIFSGFHTYQKSLKLVHFDKSYLTVKKLDKLFLRHGVELN